MADTTRPYPSNKKLTVPDPGQNFFTLTPSLHSPSLGQTPNFYDCHFLFKTLNVPQSFILFQIRILVAGGCSGGCQDSEALSSAEMYDPETDEWELVSYLPVPLF